MKKIFFIYIIALLLFSCDLLTQKADSAIHASDSTKPDDTTEPEKPNPPIITDSTIMNHDTVIDDDVLLANIEFLQSQKMYFEHASIGGNIFGRFYNDGTSQTIMNNANSHYGLNSLYLENNLFEFTLSQNVSSLYPPAVSDGIYSFGFNTEKMKATYLNYFNNGYLKDGGFLRAYRGNPTVEKNDSNRTHPKIEIFEGLADEIIIGADIIMMKFCYSDYTDSFNAYGASPEEFTQDYFEVYEELQDRAKTLNPDAKFIFWTIPLVVLGRVDQHITQGRDEVNNLIREYCKSNNEFLIAIADIESHAPNGTKLITDDSFKNGGGLEYLHNSYTYDYGHLTGEFAKKMAKIFLHTVLVMNGKIQQ